MPTHYSILAWRIPWTEEPGWLLSMGSQNQTQLKQLIIHTGTNEGYDLANKRKYGAAFSTLTPLLWQASLGLGHFESHHLI